MTTTGLLLVLCSYLIGSIPFGYLLTKHYLKANILDMGSGNIGSTNIGRVVGKKAAIFCQLLDMGKGLLMVLVVLILQSNTPAFANQEHLIYAVAIAAILGHNFSAFLKLKGGKGVNTTLGASLLIAPIPVLAAVGIYFLVKRGFKYTSLGSLAIAIALPLGALLQLGLGATFYYFVFCGLMIVIRHSSNINRLLRGTELES